MKQRFFLNLLFVIALSGCGGVTPYPNLVESSTLTTPSPLPVFHPDLEPITAENVNKLEQIDQYGDGIIYGIAISPDKQTVAVHTPKGIYLYDTSTLAQKKLIEKAAPITTTPGGRFPLAFSPDGTRLAFSVGWVVYIYDLSLNEYADRPVFSAIPGWDISEIAFSPDGQRLLLTTNGGSRRCDGGGGNYALYDFDSHLLFDRYFCTAYAKNYYRFTQDGKLYLFFASIMSTDIPFELHVTDIETGALLESALYDFDSQEHDPKKYFYDVSFDGKILATATQSESGVQTTFLDSATREELSQTNGLIAFEYSGDDKSTWRPRNAMYTQLDEMALLLYENCGNSLSLSNAVEISTDKVVAYRGSVLEVIDLSTCSVENSVRSHSSQKNIFSPDSRFLVTTTKDAILVWDITTGKPKVEISGDSFNDADNVYSFNTDGTLLLTGKLGYENVYPEQPNRKYVVSVWDVQTGKKIKELLPSTEFLDRILPTPDKEVVTIEDMSGLNFWNVRTGKLLTTIPAHVFTFSKDGSQVWVSVVNQKSNPADGIDHEQVLKLYDYQTGEILRELEPIHSWVRYLYLNEAETKIALDLQTNVPNKAPNDGIRILDLDSREVIWDIQWNVPTNPFERTPKTDDWEDYGFSKDFFLWQNGEIVAQHGFDLYTASWHFQSEDPYIVIPSGTLMRDSEIVVTRNNNLPYSYQKEIVQFWSAKTGNLLGEIRTYYRIRDVAFSPDGYLIAVSGDDGLIRIWGVKKDG